MATYRFFEVSKANEEITRLESIVTDRDAALKAAQERITALETAKPESSDELNQTKADLATAKQTIGTLEAKIVSLEAEVKAANEKAATAKVEADKQASIKAAEITAGQGQPPIKTEVTDTPANTKPDTGKLFGLARAIAAHTAQK